MEYEDPRPVILDGEHLDRIGRRVVFASADYEDLEPDTLDVQIVESAMYSLSFYMNQRLRAWYTDHENPVQFGWSAADLMDDVEKFKANLQPELEKHFYG